MLSIIID